jgi:hypothetical protein
MSRVFEMSMLTIMLTVAVSTLPRIYWAFLKVEECYQYEEADLLQELLLERNNWVLRHLSCAVAAIGMIWITQGRPEVSQSLALAVGIYAGCCLIFAALECVLITRINRMLAAVPVKVKVRDQR